MAERIESLQQVFGKFCDLEEPLREVTLLDECARPPTPALDHLFIGEHRLVDRVPVDPRGLAIDKPGLQEIKKNSLLVFVVTGITGRDFA